MITVDFASNDIDKKANLIWNECLSIIKENVTLITYNTWFIPIKPISLHNNTLSVQLPGNFFYEWIEQHYNSILNHSLKTVLGENAKLDYVIVEEEGVDLFSDNESSKRGTTEPVVEISLSKKQPGFENYLNPKYTFENYIKGEGNQLARAAAGAISENPGGTSFNPFFVYGGVGLGKTHLIQAIGNQVLTNFPDKRVIYVSSDSFTVEFVESIQNNKINEFSNFYRSMDVLIIDDIQFLIGKEKTQDLFFRIFNTLHQSGRQVILSSDKPPKDLKGMDERLISRFNWGLTADIQPPDFETRIAILNKKAEDFGMIIHNDLIEYIAGYITSNIRELEGCLIKLLANASLNSRKIDFELTKRTVREISTSKRVSISIDVINKIVSEHLNIDENKLRDKTRKQEIVFARQICMYLSKELTKSSLKTIGLHFGGRDHSTVIHACTSIEEQTASDKQLSELLQVLRNKIELACS
jgi:chromosomal replication initiator protein